MKFLHCANYGKIWEGKAHAFQTQSGKRSVNSADRLLGILRLFTVAKPVWTVEDAAKELGVSLSQTYRYFNSLVKAGLLDSAVGVACFTLGPAFLEYDRQIRLCDPMLTAARQVMEEIAQHAPEAATVLLCRRYHDRVICVHQVVGQILTGSLIPPGPSGDQDEPEG